MITTSVYIIKMICLVRLHSSCKIECEFGTHEISKILCRIWLVLPWINDDHDKPKQNYNNFAVKQKQNIHHNIKRTLKGSKCSTSLKTCCSYDFVFLVKIFQMVLLVHVEFMVHRQTFSKLSARQLFFVL